MNLSPLHEITNVGVLFGGQASAWQPNLAGYHADSYAKAQLDKLIDAAQLKLAPCAREVSQIVPGSVARLRELINTGEAQPKPIDAEPAVSVPGIVLGQIASVVQLAQLGLKPENYQAYGHSQGIIGSELLRELPQENWAEDEKLVDHVAFAFLLGAATSQATFGGMLAVRGVPADLLPGTPAVINGPTRVVYSGTPEQLAQVKREVTAIVDKHNAAIDSHERGGEHVDVSFTPLEVAAAFHHEGNRAAADQAIAWSKECGLNVDAQHFADYILVNPCTWEVGEHDYLISFDPALIAITADLTDAVILDGTTPTKRDDLATPGTEVPQPVDYAKFTPKVVTLPTGEQKVETAFSRLTGLSPIILAGMTPTTVDADIVAAAANAGYWAEMAGGGQYSEEVFNFNNDNLQAQLAPGRSAQFNSMFFDRYMWNLQFGVQRIVSKARAAGAAINGVTISAGIPELEEAGQLIRDLNAEGFPFIAFKPGTVAQIRSVIEIADAHPEADIIPLGGAPPGPT